MNRVLLSVVAVLLLACPQSMPAADATEIETYFSPRGGVAAAIVGELATATTSIDVAAYQFSHPELLKALRLAHHRGVLVRVVIDRMPESNPNQKPDPSIIRDLELRVDTAEKLHHNKYAIIDGRTVITGSFNWTRNADQRNAENLVIIHDGPTAAAFGENFATHWNHSRPFVRSAVAGFSDPRKP